MTTPKTETREARGIALHRSRGHEIHEVEPSVYRVPSSTGPGFYRVDIERETCECPDHEHRQVRCLHFYAVTIFAATKRCRRASARPERRHGERQERSGDTSPRRRSNRPAPTDTKTPRRDEAVGRGYGVAPETVLAGLDRMGS